MEWGEKARADGRGGALWAAVFSYNMINVLELLEAVLTLTRWGSLAPHRGQEMLTSPP